MQTTVAPSLTSMFTSGEGGVASVSAADAAVAVASSAARRRMYERKEDMCNRECEMSCGSPPWSADVEVQRWRS